MTDLTLVETQEYQEYLKRSKEKLKTIDKSDIIAITQKEKEIVNVINSTNLTIENQDLADDDYIFIEYTENKKIQFLEIENELIELRDIFRDLHDITKNDNHNLKIIESNIEIAKDMISQAELDIICAQTLDESHTTKYLLILSSIISALVFGYLVKK